MRTMIFTDLITMKNSLLALLGIDVALGVFFAFSMQTLVGALAAMTVIIPFMYLFSISAYDDMGGWERFRLTLPLTRRQVVWGRYASIALVLAVSMLLALVVGHVLVMVGDAVPGAPRFITSAEVGFYQVACGVALAAAIVLIAAAISLPFITRFGMTKATRILPAVIVIVLGASVALFGDVSANVTFGAFSAWMMDAGPAFIKAVIAAAIVALIVLYLVSACISTKLYRKREL